MNEAEVLLEQTARAIESTANFLRGMTMDPAVPNHAKDAIHVKIRELDQAAFEAVDFLEGR